MSWQAGPDCPPHNRDALERAVNALPTDWLAEPTNGEVFPCKEDCELRLRGYSLSAGFDIVRSGGGTAAFPAQEWRCIHHGTSTRNARQLEDRVKRDVNGNITTNRKRNCTQVSQLGCNWRARLSWKSAVRGTGPKSWLLTVWPGHSHPLADSALVYPGHLSQLPEYQQLASVAKPLRIATVAYRESRRITNINYPDIGITLSRNQYYNLVRRKLDKTNSATDLASTDENTTNSDSRKRRKVHTTKFDEAAARGPIPGSQ